MTVSPASATLAALGDSARFTARVLDQYGNAMVGATVSWSSNNVAVATVNTSGVATAAGDGSATITATSGNASGTATVTVEREASTVVVTPTEAELVPGDTVRLTAQAEDANGFAIPDAVFSWSSSDEAVAVVDSTGLVRAVWDGEATITATANSVSGSATVTIGREVAAVILTPLETALAPGDSLQLVARAIDADSVEVGDVLFSWSSSDEAVATVDSTGLVRAVGRGDATITAAAGSVTASATVMVSVTTSTVIVSPSRSTVVVGDSVRLSAEARDHLGGDIADASFAWVSSDASVATVDTSGLVRATGEGRATITATSGTASGSARLTVAAMSDRGALVAFYRSTGGAKWVRRTNWLTDAPLGDWYGVTADGGRVVGLHLASNNLTGVIPPQIEHLSHLRRLTLRTNSIEGGIPQELGNLPALVTLELTDNALSGPIPPELGQLDRLGILLLGGNRLSGSIPPELGDLTSARTFGLEKNDLSGELPPKLATPPYLTLLNVRDNLLRGPVPDNFPGSSLDEFSFSVPASRNVQLCLPGTADFVAWVARIGVTGPRYCNASDRTALKNLYELTSGADWIDSSGWLSGPALGEWHGVEADRLGRVTALDLTGNGLSGQLPSQLGRLSAMSELKIGDNSLTGRLPMSLTSVPLREFRYADTGLCTPADASFREWLTTITVHEGTGVECTALTDRDILELFYRSTGGPNWTRSDNWVTDAPLRDWYGVTVDGAGRVTWLSLRNNNLRGDLLSELGQLTGLKEIDLTGNRLTGPIPPALGDLPRLEWLVLDHNLLEGGIPPALGNLSALVGLLMVNNRLTGSITPELGNLSKLGWLQLDDNVLSGPIPRELGRLSSLRLLLLNSADLTGPIPPELGNLSQLRSLALRNNRLTGHIPAELGSLRDLTSLLLDGNSLSGPIPHQLDDLVALEDLRLEGNDLTGALPAPFGRLRNLRHLTLSNNARVSGVLPRSLQSLGALEVFLAGGTALCAPDDPDFLGWLETIGTRRVSRCPTGERSRAYLTQTVQSLQYPVPLVAGKPALLRVFVTVPEVTDAPIPPVRATFYHDGSVVDTIDISQGSAAIPVEIEEGVMVKSANAHVPARLVQPGLEIVIEVDPGGTLDPGLGVQRRIPETGRQAVDVRDMPTMQLTVIPYLWETQPDSSILEITEGMTAGDTLLWATRTFLPVGDLEVVVHDPVWTSTNDPFRLRGEVEALRVMEGNPGYYMGMMNGLPAGVAYLPGWSSVATPDQIVIAHELGHNMNLYHAPCGRAGDPDPSFPSPTGSIGAWGYDFRGGGRLVAASRKDLMSYCNPPWISDYSFNRALFHRLNREAEAASVANAPAARTLLLWGGLAPNGAPFLEPAFVMDAPPVLPVAAGEYSLSGQTGGGEELFALSFDMREVSHGGGPSFAFALPVRADWADRLASITLSGPAGSVSLDGDSDHAMTILRDPRTGEVRGILRDLSPEGVAPISRALGRGLEVLFSRGVPDGAGRWR